MRERINAYVIRLPGSGARVFVSARAYGCVRVYRCVSVRACARTDACVCEDVRARMRACASVCGRVGLSALVEARVL